MTDILSEILAVKAQEVAQAKARIPFEEIRRRALSAAVPRGFVRAIEAKIEEGKSAVIAEVKKASPSKGVICRDFDPERTARSYEEAGATCLSVLTDTRFFMGGAEAFAAARSATSLPMLRKDFMIDPYQVYESRAMGADAVLVIMRALEDAAAVEISRTAVGLGMDVLVETHDASEIERALKLPARLIGINNRNLNTFVTDVGQTLRLRHLVGGDRIVVSESAIATPGDVAQLRKAGVSAFLVGEAFMKTPDPGRALAELFAGTL